MRAALRRRLYGRRRLVPVFELLRSRAIAGLYPAGDTYAETGEIGVLDAIAARCRDRRAVVLDVGANVGDWAAEALAHIEDVELHSFEPSTSACALYRARIGDRATLYPFALGAANGSAKLHLETAASPTASLYGDGRVTETVEIRRLDDLAFGHVDFLKIDVEGHELAVLDGGRETLSRTDAVQFEFGVGNLHSRTFFRDFYELLNGEFDLHRIMRDGLLPIRTYEPRYEVFTGANYLALRRC